VKILCDANIGRKLAQALIAAGHDVLQAALAFREEDDEIILERARVENRILVTCDRDFGELVFGRGAEPPPAIIYVRFEPDDVSEIIPRLLAVLEPEALRDHLTVIGDKIDRRRPFPRTTND
jgi:predicted nuclease of predicted toxin-antitoxin system